MATIKSLATAATAAKDIGDALVDITECAVDDGASKVVVDSLAECALDVESLRMALTRLKNRAFDIADTGMRSIASAGSDTACPGCTCCSEDYSQCCSESHSTRKLAGDR